MSGNNDALTQMMLMQMRQQNRRPSAQAQLAQQMMQQSAQGGPIWGTSAAVARAIPGILGAFMAQRAETSDREREDQQMQQMQDRQDKQQLLGGQALAAAMGGAPAQAPQMPQQPAQDLPQTPMAAAPALPPPASGDGGVAPPYGRNAALVPQRDALLDAPPQQLAAASGARSAASGIPEIPGGYRANPGFEGVFNGAPRPAGVVNANLGGAPPSAPQGPPPAAAPGGVTIETINQVARLAASGGAGSAQAAAVLPQLRWQFEQAQRPQGELREMNGPQGAGLYRIGPNGASFVGGRMPLQEGAETFSGTPQTVMQNGQPVLVQIGSRGTIRPMGGYEPRPPVETAPRSPERLRQDIELANAGRPNTNINTGDSPQAILARSDVETIKSQNEVANQARVLLPLFDRAEEAIRNVPEGAGAQFAPILGQIASAFGANVSGTSEAEVLRALTSTLAPLQRVAGSGATSDRDIGLYLQAVPRLGNTRDGNLALVDMGRRAAQRRIEEATIWRQFAGTPDVMDRLNSLPPLWSDEERALLRTPPAGVRQPNTPPPAPRPAGMVDRARARNGQPSQELPAGFVEVPR